MTATLRQERPGTGVRCALTRLPRNQNEGHLPRIALTTGGADALECLLRKVGIEDSEFTPESGSGRVNLFAGGTTGGVAMNASSAGSNAYSPTFNGGAAFTNAETWWESGANLARYDLVLHSCEGLENSTNKSATAKQALVDYANAGGRVFASHWHNDWIEHGASPWPAVAVWSHLADPPNPYTATIDMSFPKGFALAAWLHNAGGSTTLGQVTIRGAKRTVMSVVSPTQGWFTATPPASVQYVSFLTPVGGTACGQVVFSDLHVTSGSGSAVEDDSDVTLPFPSGCRTTDLSPQEKVLEFMLFDLLACI